MTMTHKERTLRFLRPAAETVFTLDEYRRRLERVRAAMAAGNIDTLYLTSPEAVCYLSGYRAEWYQAQGPTAWLPVTGIAVHADADDFIHIEVQNEEILAGFTTVSRDLRIFGGDAQPSEDVIGFIVETLDGEGWLGGRVGLEMHSYRPNRAVSERLQAGFESVHGRLPRKLIVRPHGRITAQEAPHSRFLVGFDTAISHTFRDTGPMAWRRLCVTRS